MPSPLLPIVDPAVAGEDLAGVVREMAAAGVRWLEYRDKLADDRRACSRAAAMVAEGRAQGVLVLVNDRVDVALAAGAAGAHLGQEDMPVAVARRVLGDDAIIGLSVDTLDEAVAAARLPVDYVALGPVFRTTTKPDAGPVVGIEGVRAVADRLDKPLMAVGGIDVDRVADVIGAGAAAVAAISACFGPRGVRHHTGALLRAADRAFEEANAPSS